MSNDQTFKIIATPAERWFLALFLTQDCLKFKGAKATGLWRFRCSLGLVAPTESYLGHYGRGQVALSLDWTTRRVFTVTPERTEFLNDCLEQANVTGAQLGFFQRILAQLQDKAPSEDPTGIPAFDEAQENWRPTLAPIDEMPVGLGPILVNCLQTSPDFAAFRAQLLSDISAPRGIAGA